MPHCQGFGGLITNQLITNHFTTVYISVVSNWMEISFIENEKELRDVYLGMLKGDADLGKGYIVKL